MRSKRLVPNAVDLSRTLHAVGDMHHAQAGGFSANRKGHTTRGINKPLFPQDVAAHVFVGDITQNGLAAEDDLWAAFRDGLTSGSPKYAVAGNHDIQDDVRTPAQAHAAWGLPASQNYGVDLGFAKMCCVFPGDDYATHNSGSFFSASSLAWLEASIQSAGNQPVIVVCHFPLYDTVAGAGADAGVYYRSIDSGFYAATIARTADSQDVLDLLDAYPNVKAWVSGHTHSSVSAPGLLTMVNTGTRNIAHINTSAVVSVDRAGLQTSPINTMLLTYTEADQIEVRLRGHHAGGFWNTINGQRVTVMTPD